jgi:DNA replication protein DnaC
MSSPYNRIAEVRPGATFSTYYPDPAYPSQAAMRDNLLTLSQAILAKAEAILTEDYPFKQGRMIFISGPPGVGKTHLIEALINAVVAGNAQLSSKILLLRGNFTRMHSGSFADFMGCPIVIIDDLYAERQSLDMLDASDLSVLMRLVMDVYESRRLVLLTSNFVLKKGVEKFIQDGDLVGRASSRLAELMANSGAVAIDGEDYRRKLAAARGEAELFEDL